MKQCTAFFFGFLCASFLPAQTFPVENIMLNGASTKRINFVYTGDGYTSAQLADYVTHVQAVNTALFNQSPFLEYKNFFNAYAIKVPSAESGAKHPGTATDVTEPASPVTNPNNYFGSRFDVAGIHRLLVPASTSQVLTVVSANVPDYDQVLTLVNSTVYGGSGGTLATSSVHSLANEIMYHEIGHSFAALGDEYWFDCTERKNRTANNNAATIVWKNWLNSNGVGIYAIGTSGAAAACYRPHQSCKMQSLGLAFCSVCKEAFIDRIYQLVSPIDQFSPANNTVNFTGTSMTFSLNLVLPNPNTLQVEWVLNGTVIATSGTSVNVASSQLLNGNNTLQAKVRDATAQSRSYWPATSGYLNTVTWNLSFALPAELLDLRARLVNNQTLLEWETATEKGLDYFEVQKSEDGYRFEAIGKVRAAGHSATLHAYQFTDPHPLYGATYYRLRQTDLDGQVAFSPIAIVNRIDKIRYEIFPNPAEDFLSVRLNTQVKDVFTLRIVAMNGLTLYEQTNEPAESCFAEIPLQGYAPGLYMLIVEMGANRIVKTFEKI